MRSREVLIVLAVIAIVVTLFPPQPTKEEVSEPITMATPEQTAPSETEAPNWSVGGFSLTDSPEAISNKLGKPNSDKTISGIRTTVWKESNGSEIRRTEFLRDQTLGLMGTILQRDGETVVRPGTTASEMRKGLGKPLRVTQNDDHEAHQYEGARVYLRNGVAFGVVIEGAI